MFNHGDKALFRYNVSKTDSIVKGYGRIVRSDEKVSEVLVLSAISLSKDMKTKQRLNFKEPIAINNKYLSVFVFKSAVSKKNKTNKVKSNPHIESLPDVSPNWIQGYIFNKHTQLWYKPGTFDPTIVPSQDDYWGAY